MIFIIYFLVLGLLSLFYYRIAKHYDIVDKPNKRSSHSEPIIRGGGIIFVLGILLYAIFNSVDYTYFIIGLSILAIISFLDDLYSLSSLLRFAVQFIAVFLTFYQLNLLHSLPLWILALAFFFTTGLLNIYNFMDGINGITAINALSIILPLIFVNQNIILFIDNEFLVMLLIAILVFSFYNIRQKALMFAGDVGSITIGLTLIFFILLLINKTFDYRYLLFTVVYAVDGGTTILQRILRKKNIFNPHRDHLYQVLCDHTTLSHIKISILFSTCQLIICSITIILVNYTYNMSIALIAIPLVLSILSIFIKNKVLAKK